MLINCATKQDFADLLREYSRASDHQVYQELHLKPCRLLLTSSPLQELRWDEIRGVNLVV